MYYPSTSLSLFLFLSESISLPVPPPPRHHRFVYLPPLWLMFSISFSLCLFFTTFQGLFCNPSFCTTVSHSQYGPFSVHSMSVFLVNLLRVCFIINSIFFPTFPSFKTVVVRLGKRHLFSNSLVLLSIKNKNKNWLFPNNNMSRRRSRCLLLHQFDTEDYKLYLINVFNVASSTMSVQL